MEPIDLRRVRTLPIETRANKVALETFAKAPRAGKSFAEFLDSLPDILVGADFRAVVEAIVTARKNGRPVIVSMGAHAIKCGLNPVLIALMESGIITTLATNGAGAIHDFELAMIGQTSEDVGAGLVDGTFGMARETGQRMNEAIGWVRERPEAGMGSLLAEQLDLLEAPYREVSLLSAGRRCGIPTTIHAAIGTDIIHMHPEADGAALGQATFNDFRILSTAVCDLSGGVFVNIGSAVIMPEVFLKAFTIAQNVGSDLHDFVTVNMDMIPHYRPNENVIRRPPAVGGRGYALIGRFELLLPLLAQAIVEKLEA